MADEAVLRIVMQGEGGGTTTAASSSTASPPQQQTTIPTPQQQTTPPAPTAGGFDPVEEAKKRRDREVRVSQVEAEYQKLFSPQQAQFDPAVEAQKRLDADKRRMAVDAEYAKLIPVNPPFDPVKEAQKRLDADKKRAEIDAEYAKLSPTAPFDPMEEARKRREKEEQKAQVDAAYKEQYGDGSKNTDMDSVLKIVDSLRGTIGGVFGQVVGSVLDVVSSINKMQGTGSAAVKVPNISSTSKVPSTSSIPAGVPKTGGAGATSTAAGGAGAVGAEAGAAAGGAGAMASLAAAAGPIGIAIAVFSAVVTTLSAVKDAGTAAVRALGGFAQAVASPDADPATVMEGMGGAITKTTEKFIYLGNLIGVFGPIIGEAAKEMGALMQAITATADRYGEYNPQIAQAQAIAEVRHTLGDMRRAQEAGGELARFIQTQGELQQKFEDVKVKILVKIVPIVTRVLEILESIMSSGGGIEVAITALTAPISILADLVAEIVGVQRADRLGDVDDPTTQLFDPRFRVPGTGTEADPGWVPRR